MPGFTDEQIRAITTAISRQAGPIGPCPVCGHHEWALNSAGLVYISIQPVQAPSESEPFPTSTLLFGGPQLANVALICQHCGNTQLLNVFRLGVGSILGLTEDKPLKT